MNSRLAPLRHRFHHSVRKATRSYSPQQSATTDVWPSLESRQSRSSQDDSSQRTTLSPKEETPKAAVASSKRALEAFWASPIKLGQYDNLDEFLTTRGEPLGNGSISACQTFEEALDASKITTQYDKTVKDDKAVEYDAKAASKFFSTLSTILKSDKKSSQSTIQRIVDSQFFQKHLEARHLGESELSILSKVFVYISLDLDNSSGAPRSIRFARAIKLIRQYQSKNIALSPDVWAIFLTSASRYLSKEKHRDSEVDQFQRAATMFRTTLDLNLLLEIWGLFFLAHGAAPGLESAQPDSNDAQQRFFALIPGWRYAEDLSIDQRVFCSALLTSAVLFQQLGRLPSSWTDGWPSSQDQFLENESLDFSYLGGLELSFLAKLASAVHGTTSNRMVLRMGLARMSVPSKEANTLLDNMALLMRYENDVREHMHSIQAHAAPGGLALRATQRISKWIETAPKLDLSKMFFALSGNEIRSLVPSRRPLLEKMSLRLYQIDSKLPQRIWDGYSFNDGFSGEFGTSKRSPVLSAIILRQLYRNAESDDSGTIIRRFEATWQQLDLSETRMPNAFWWLRFRFLWRVKRFRQALEAYKVAVFELEVRTALNQRPEAILRLTNKMLFLVARYGNIGHALAFSRSLYKKNIEFNAETFRWSIRLHLRLRKLSVVKDLLKGYFHYGGKGIHLGEESQMLFTCLVKKFPHLSSPRAVKDWMYPAINATLSMREPDIMAKLWKGGDTVLDETLTSAVFGGSPSRHKSMADSELSRWAHFFEAYVQMAEVLAKGDWSNKVSLLVTLHQHLQDSISMGRPPLEFRPRLRKLGNMVIRQFDEATLSEQVCVAFGRLYSGSSTANTLVDGDIGFHEGSSTNIKIVEDVLIPRLISRQLENVGMGEHIKRLGGIRLPVTEATLIARGLPREQRKTLLNLLQKLHTQAMETAPTPAGTSTVQRNQQADKIKTRIGQPLSKEARRPQDGLDFSTGFAHVQGDDPSAKLKELLLLPRPRHKPKPLNRARVRQLEASKPHGDGDGDGDDIRWRTLSITSPTPMPTPTPTEGIGSPYELEELDF